MVLEPSHLSMRWLFCSRLEVSEFAVRQRAVVCQKVGYALSPFLADFLRREGIDQRCGNQERIYQVCEIIRLTAGVAKVDK
jgi:hypothetical protein